MKNLIYIITILISSGCYAQKKLTEGTLKVKSTIYEVKKSEYGKNRIAVFNQNIKYPHGIGNSSNPRAFPMKHSDMHVDAEKVNEIVYSVLKNKLKELKDNHEFMNIGVVFEQDGSLVDVEYFTLSQNTLINIEEIDQINKKLKNEIRMRFTGRDYLDYKAFAYSFPMIKF